MSSMSGKRFLSRTGRGALAFMAAALIAACGPNGGSNGGQDGDGGVGGGDGGTGPCAVDCSTLQDTPICDEDSGQCVACTLTDDVCPDGEICQNNTCVTGCYGQEDCQAPQMCNPTTNQCVDCLGDMDCGAGTVCDTGSGQCVAGCSPTQACPGSETCCDGMCQDLQTDMDNCGICGNACPDHPNTQETCDSGMCSVAACENGFDDCNQNGSDGCEWDTNSGGACLCDPGETMPCYDGPPGTEGVGTCIAGTTTCLPSGTGWSTCVGQILPSFDDCNDGLDNDCSGIADNPPDEDGDGWTACEGDCCDNMGAGCGDPGLVNPGAFEVDGNMVDDDCDGTVDNALATCDNGLPSNSSVGLHYSNAMDLCRQTLENPPTPDQRTWGVISADFHLADGQGTPAANSRSIRTGYGSGVTPILGNALAVLSSGVAAAQAAPNNTAPNWLAFQEGEDMLTTSAPPNDWLTANGGVFPNAPGCPQPITTAQDPIMLRLRVRVPTNANSFSVNSFFYSSEYPEWVCSEYNDFLLVLLDSAYPTGTGMMDNPVDKNLAIYTAGASVYPVGVNLAFGTGLFSQCINGPTGCGLGSVAGNNNACMGTGQLAGTGFDINNPPGGGCGSSTLAGGGTGWLTTSGNVVPGEIIELRFIVWDTGDHIYDSLVLLDNFQWSVTASTPGTDQATNLPPHAVSY